MFVGRLHTYMVSFEYPEIHGLVLKPQIEKAFSTTLAAISQVLFAFLAFLRLCGQIA